LYDCKIRCHSGNNVLRGNFKKGYNNFNYVIEIMMGRRGRRRKQLLDDLKEKKRYCKLKEEALDRNLWRTRFGRGYGPVVRQTTE
jgi:hypothetical protein